MDLHRTTVARRSLTSDSALSWYSRAIRDWERLTKLPTESADLATAAMAEEGRVFVAASAIKNAVPGEELEQCPARSWDSLFGEVGGTNVSSSAWLRLLEQGKLFEAALLAAVPSHHGYWGSVAEARIGILFAHLAASTEACSEDRVDLFSLDFACWTRDDRKVVIDGAEFAFMRRMSVPESIDDTTPPYPHA